MNRCDRSGRLVSAAEPIPDAPFDFVWPSPGPIFGCNRLRCGACGEALIQRPGFLLDHALSRAEIARLWNAGWEGLAGVLRAVPQGRVYACRCAALSIERWRDVESDHPREADAPFPPSWACSGHPRLMPPVELDGESLSGDLTELARGVILDERAGSRPDFLRAYPAAWLQRAYFLTAHLPESGRLAEAVADLLLDADPTVAGSAVDFFQRVPQAPGASGLARLVPLDRRDEPLPFRAGQRFGELVQRALAARLRHGADASVREAALQAVLWPYPGAVAELVPLLDRDWLAQHAPDVLRHVANKLVLRAIIRALQGAPRLAEAVQAMQATGALSAEAFDQVARQELG